MFQAKETLHGGCLGLQKVNDLEELKTKFGMWVQGVWGVSVCMCVCVCMSVQGQSPSSGPTLGGIVKRRVQTLGAARRMVSRASRGRGHWSEGRRWKWGERRPFPLLGGTRHGVRQAVSVNASPGSWPVRLEAACDWSVGQDRCSVV